MFYELATLTAQFGTIPQAVAGIKTFVTADEARGELLGCWMSDIGQLNQIAVLRGFEQQTDLHAERQRALLSADPFGCAQYLTNLEMHSYAGFPWLPHVRTGNFGPIYEIRTYELKTGGLQPTLAAWEQALPQRVELSPCVVAMYALDGTPRFTQIWPYTSLEERSKARGGAVQQGIWPPKGGPAWLTTNMRSGVFLPTDISPLK